MLCADRVPIVSAHFESAMTQTGSPDPRIDLVCITSSCPRQFLQNFGTPSSLPGLTSLNRSGFDATILWHFDAAEQAPSTASSATEAVQATRSCRCGPAAVRDFDHANVRFGSKAAQAISASRQRMSASPQKRTYASLHRDVRFVPFASLTRCNKSAPVSAAIWVFGQSAGAPGQAHRKDRALVRLARHGHVAAHHARELARERKAEPGAPERRAVSESAWVKSWNSFACCWAVSPMLVSATDGLVLRPPHAAQLSSQISAMR
jgi:hypothetical protein